MPFEKTKRNPRAFIAIGVCFMGAGVALNIALHAHGAGGAGIGLIGVGVMFLVIGAAQRRKLDSSRTTREDDDRGPA